ncbi:NADH-quinone oxidoreductase subunit NuoF [uncultured Sphingorhabdus sp.]|uniref:formate dehydrogenase beta subunit n=1 Tax=uncultured Sphingorhabdus sp. TaxID=1686106 RepID=UPI002604BE4B|nr:formate dehydrogenase beta subunit [uncultured Sphingorhabdus sp.]HMS20162.1 NADH-ubiquinone oxidoreductase-F iron-sulfur binding region domain-containing protein [Sphingorhabdus sp.]
MSAIRIFVPIDAAAQSVGANEVAAAIAMEASKRGIDIELVRNGSRGMLWLEPLVEVETDAGRLAYGPVSAEDVPSLFDASFHSGGEHRLGHGLTESIPYFAKQERLSFARCGVIDPLNLADYEAHGGLAGLRRALTMVPRDVVAEISESGLRGRGGAGFPTGIKWKTALEQPAGQRYVCANADEGDSGTFADRMLMEGDPFALIEGMAIAGHAIGADIGYIYIRSEYPHAIATMRHATEIWHAAGLSDFRVEIRVGGGAYICGEESSMLESIEGKRGQVRAKPPIPAISGLFGKPTAVNNVLTLAAVCDILAKGAAYYRDFGMGRSRGTQAFQLAGDVARGGLVEKAFGVTLRELVEDFGGGTRSGKPLRAVQAGGPLGAYIPATALDVEMDYEALAATGAMLGHGGIVLFNDSVDMAKQARFAFEFCAIESCGKCTPCRIGAVRGKEVMDKVIAGEDRTSNLALVEDLCEIMTDGSLCAMGGLTPMPVLSALRHFPEDFGRE